MPMSVKFLLLQFVSFNDKIFVLEYVKRFPFSYPQKTDIKLMMQLRKEGHNIQFMATEDAISAYNFMTAEGRVVAAALIPPTSVRKKELHAIDVRLHSRNL